MKNWLSAPVRVVSAIATFTALSLWVTPIFAKDIFRTTNTRNIGDNTEAAFKALFKEGNYPEARRYLKLAESTDKNEPLAYAIQASFAFKDQDWKAFKFYSTKTMQLAQQINRYDPVRGNLYTAVGYFLEGTYSFKQDNSLAALTKLQQVFQYLDEAKKIAPNDPEVNLLKGYMDLILSVNLPFSDPSQGIESLEKYASPGYLANRGIAVGYRDLKQYNKALEYVNKALQQAPKNPELFYLKAQILAFQGNTQKNSALFKEANNNFKTALSKSNQLPKWIVSQIFYEHCQTQMLIDIKQRDCYAYKQQIDNGSGKWGPAKLPQLTINN